MSSTVAPRPPARRRRLAAEERMRQIIEAALIEFSEKGFTATRMDDIAARAGLSKGGLYAHFKSKDQIFESLLFKVLSPSFNNRKWMLDDGDTLAEVVDAFIAHTYDRVTDPDFIAALRLLITESHRAPHLVDYWRREVLDIYLKEQKTMLEHCRARGLVRHSPLTQQAELLMAPALYAAITRMIFGEKATQASLKDLRRAHAQLLMELLEPVEA
ncbi:putative transcription regulator protein [Ectothiorhodospira sp. PHS-1]|uniref:TetR/AcrR family transcriptional regulator n=1 Tax=Ectothiorhodospira sp. PHS-1 TaxID=519989 RepID=UPI00024A84FB|nr:TetR/AcrR family transcriptional regulator [Ectothiorhodospira sp. PHS-1]EHQ52796.1 putative transcription regulator protein [Ectothiorhodospira sp. PHS-1]